MVNDEMKKYIVSWCPANIGECRYISDILEDAERFYADRLDEGYQPTLYSEETITIKKKIK